MQKFNVGDKVLWCGDKCTITEVNHLYRTDTFNPDDYDDHWISEKALIPVGKTTVSQYEKSINEMIAHCKRLLIDKHEEYATEDDFHNFNVAAEMQSCTPERALIGMMDKHVVSVHDLVDDAMSGIDVPLEKWREKIGDNINYLLLLWALVNR